MELFAFLVAYAASAIVAAHVSAAHPLATMLEVKRRMSMNVAMIVTQQNLYAT